LRSSRACSTTGLRDCNGSSDTMENTLLSDWSKSFWFRGAADIGGGAAHYFLHFPYNNSRREQLCSTKTLIVWS
jgi:hypothetical protein